MSKISEKVVVITVVTLTDEQLYSKNKRVEDLILQIANGDKNAVGDLYEFVKTDVYAYALSKLKNKTDAEDVLHDTFVNVYKYACKYKPIGKPMAWIITIERNLIKRWFQLQVRTAVIDDSLENTFYRSDFESERINSEFLRELLKTLSEEEREIISLHVVSGFKHKEIARLLCKPLSTVLSKYNRAIKKLKVIIKEGEDA